LDRLQADPAPGRVTTASPACSAAPARWPGWLAAGLRLLSPGGATGAGAAIAGLTAPLLGRRRATALAQLELALPDRTAAEREAIWRESLRHHGRSLVELARLAGPAAERDRLVSQVEIGGAENADRARALARGKGVVVVTAHVGNWELCLAAMAEQGHPMAVVHHGLDRPGLSAWLAGVRTRRGDVQLVELGQARAGELLAEVRGGRHLVAMMDQNARRDEGAFAPFFGAPACTRRGPVVLAIRLGVPLLPAFSHRLGDGPRHRVEFGAPIEVAPEAPGVEAGLDARVESALTRVNASIEAAIRARPEQWIWSHRRFRTRPEGEHGPGEPAVSGV